MPLHLVEFPGEQDPDATMSAEPMSDIEIHRAYGDWLSSAPPEAQRPWDAERHWADQPRDKRTGDPVRIPVRPAMTAIREAQKIVGMYQVLASYDGSWFWLEGEELQYMPKALKEQITSKGNDSSKGRWGMRNGRWAISFDNEAFEWALYRLEQWQRRST